MIVYCSSPFLIDTELAAYEIFPPHCSLRCGGDMASCEDYQNDDSMVASETLASEKCEGSEEYPENLGREHN
jgi:hypothetical protein